MVITNSIKVKMMIKNKMKINRTVKFVKKFLKLIEMSKMLIS